MHRRNFDDLASEATTRVQAEPARLDELDDLISLAKRLIPPLGANAAAVHRVYLRNPQSIWAVRRDRRSIGVVALLLLNQGGLDRLLSSELDVIDPGVGSLTEPNEKAAGVYFWAVALPGVAVEALRAVSLWLRSPPYAAADLYTRTTTPGGTRLTVNLGFRPIADTGLYRFRRLRNRAKTAIAIA